MGSGSPPLHTADPFFRVSCNGDELFISRVSPGGGGRKGRGSDITLAPPLQKPDEGVPKLRASKQSDVSWNCSIPLHGDVYFEFLDYDRLGGVGDGWQSFCVTTVMLSVCPLQNEVMCGFAFHTAFVAKDNTLVFKREEVGLATWGGGTGCLVCAFGEQSASALSDRQSTQENKNIL